MLRAALAAIPCAVFLGTACTHSPILHDIPLGPSGSVAVFVADSAGAARNRANAYLAEDLRITSDAVNRKQAGVWTDERGFASLGAWRPGEYTLIVRAIGFKKMVQPIVVRAGKTDTVNVKLSLESLLLW